MKLINKKLTIEEEQNNNNPSEPKIGLFLINQKLGQIKGTHKVDMRINYWSNGKVDAEGREVTPYLFSDYYTKEVI